MWNKLRLLLSSSAARANGEAIQSHFRSRILEQAAVLCEKGNVPSLVVLGLHNHGKSSFINTLFRVTNKEELSQPFMVRRAETGPYYDPQRHRKITEGPPRLRSGVPTTVAPKLHWILHPESGNQLLKIFDTPPITYDEELGQVKSLQGPVYTELVESGECVILVADSETVFGKKGELIAKIAKDVRQRKLPFIVVATKTDKVDTVRYILKRLSGICGSESVYGMTNYLECADKCMLDNNEEINMTVLAIVSQSLEYVKQKRLEHSGSAISCS